MAAVPPEAAYLSMMELIDLAPILLAAQLQYVHSNDQNIRVLAEQENVGSGADLGPRVLTTVFRGARLQGEPRWADQRRRQHGHPGGRVSISTHSNSALAEDWNAAAGSGASPRRC